MEHKKRPKKHEATDDEREGRGGNREIPGIRKRRRRRLEPLAAVVRRLVNKVKGGGHG